MRVGGGQLVRVPGPVQLLRGVRGEGEPGAVAGRVRDASAAGAGRPRRRRPPASAARPGARSPAGGSSGRSARPGSPANRPTPAAARAESGYDSCGPVPNQRACRSVRRQVEPDAHPRPGAVPVGRGHDLHPQGDLVGDGPAVGDVDGPRAAGGADPDAHHGPVRVDRHHAVHQPVQTALAPAALRRPTVRAVVRDPPVVVGGRAPQLQPRAVDVEAEQPAEPRRCARRTRRRTPWSDRRTCRGACDGRAGVRRRTGCATRRARAPPTARRRPARRGPSPRSRRRPRRPRPAGRRSPTRPPAPRDGQLRLGPQRAVVLDHRDEPQVRGVDVW